MEKSVYKIVVDCFYSYWIRMNYLPCFNINNYFVNELHFDKAVSLSELLDNLNGYENNMLYEDMTKTEGPIVNEIFKICLNLNGYNAFTKLVFHSRWIIYNWRTFRYRWVMWWI